MGLDVGMKTIGVAVTDELGLAAHPVEVIARQGTTADLARLKQLVDEREVTDIVVGMPLELSGNEGRRARRVRMFMDALQKHLGADLRVHEWDERFSTAAVERVLVEADMSRQKRKRLVDKQAAAYILQGWLDAQRRAQ
jgi:putative Holliday junction resolvase